jgi:hypothetical protein
MTNSVAGWWNTSSGVPTCSIWPLVHDHDAVGDFQCLVLVVGDEDAGDMKLIVQPAQPDTQLFADLRVQGAERLVEQ